MGIKKYLILIFFSVSALGAQTSFDLYSQGKSVEAFQILLKEFNTPIQNHNQFLNHLRLGTTLFAQESSISQTDLAKLYSLAEKHAKQAQMNEVVALEKKDILAMVQKPLTSDQTDKELNEILKEKKDSLKKRTKLLALAIASQRKITLKDKNPEWNYLLGKARHYYSEDGSEFLETYLNKLKSISKTRLQEILKMLEDDYRFMNSGELSEEDEQKLATFKKKF